MTAHQFFGLIRGSLEQGKKVGLKSSGKSLIFPEPQFLYLNLIYCEGDIDRVLKSWKILV